MTGLGAIYSVSAEEKSTLDLFIPSVSEIFWSLLIVVILAIAFYKFILPKFNTVLEKRSELIEGKIEKAKEAEDEANKLKDEYNLKVSGADKEVQEIITSAKQDAGNIISVAKQDANDNAEKIITNANTVIDSKVKQAKLSLEKEMGSLAVDLAEKIVKGTLVDEAKRSEIIDNFLNEIEGEPTE